MSVDERIKKVEVIINGIINSYFIADQNLKMLIPLLEDEKIYTKWDHTDGVDGVSAIRMALYMHILSDMRAIMFDPNGKVASMKNIINAFNDARFIKKLKEIYCKPNKTILFTEHDNDKNDLLVKAIEEEDVDCKTKTFDDTLAYVLSDYQKLEKSEVGKRVNKARNKMISHVEVATIETERKLYEASDFGLKFSDAKEIINQSKGIIFGAALLITRSSYELNGFINHHIIVAKKFWGKIKNA